MLMAIEERDLARAYAKALVDSFIPFHVRFHDGMLLWLFSVTKGDLENAATVFGEAAQGV